MCVRDRSCGSWRAEADRILVYLKRSARWDEWKLVTDDHADLWHVELYLSARDSNLVLHSLRLEGDVD